MQVHQAQASTALASLRATNAAQGLVVDVQAGYAAVAKGQNSDGEAPGGVLIHLSSEAVEHLRQTSQGADDTKYEGPLSQSVRNGLTDALNNPEYAAKRAELIGTSRDLILVQDITKVDPEQMAKRNAKVESVFLERKALYENLVSSGTPSVEILAKLLEFNASQPNSYNDVLGGSEAGLNRTEFAAAQHEFLRQTLSRANST